MVKALIMWADGEKRRGKDKLPRALMTERKRSLLDAVDTWKASEYPKAKQ